MAIIVGVDEAGYGPNLGPLAVAATAWHIEEEPAAPARASTASAVDGSSATTLRRTSTIPDLYKLLRKGVVRSPAQSTRRVAIADSKALYKAGFGVRQLELGVLAALTAMQSDDESCIERVSELLRATAADPDGRRQELPCHADDEQLLPVEALAKEICQLAAKLREACNHSGVQLVALRARLVFPAEFNELVDYFGSKGAALSHITLQLVRRIVDEASAIDPRPLSPDSCPLAPHSFLICLDKHGGRSRYTAILQHHFPESWIEPISENRNISRYRWQHGDWPVEAHFRVGCEEFLPTALASMTAKYHRELAMKAFNAFWTSRLPELQPTAGYPGDAQRFKAAIEPLQRQLGMDDRLLWRSR
jgi:ribonuclease HII